MARHRPRHDDDRDETIETAVRRPAARDRGRDVTPAEPAATLLDLQARAGNAAVADLVAGSGPTVLREAVQAAGAGKDGPTPAKDGPGRVGGSLVIRDLELTIPLHSFSFVNGPRSGSGTSGSAPPDLPTELAVVVDMGPSTPVLQQAAAAGRSLGRVVVEHGVRLAADDVVITSIRFSGAGHGEETVSVGLAASKVSRAD